MVCQPGLGAPPSDEDPNDRRTDMRLEDRRDETPRRALVLEAESKTHDNLTKNKVSAGADSAGLSSAINRETASAICVNRRSERTALRGIESRDSDLAKPPVTSGKPAARRTRRRSRPARRSNARRP